MRWSLVLLAACSSAPTKTSTPEPIASAPPPVAPAPPPPEPAAGPEVARGASLFAQRGCKTCHDPGAGQRAIGAPLQGLWGTQVELADGTKVAFDEAYVRESILEPTAKLRVGFNPVMPAYPIFTDAEMADVTAYIRSLR